MNFGDQNDQNRHQHLKVVTYDMSHIICDISSPISVSNIAVTHLGSTLGQFWGKFQNDQSSWWTGSDNDRSRLHLISFIVLHFILISSSAWFCSLNWWVIRSPYRFHSQNEIITHPQQNFWLWRFSEANTATNFVLAVEVINRCQ